MLLSIFEQAVKGENSRRDEVMRFQKIEILDHSVEPVVPRFKGLHRGRHKGRRPRPSPFFL